MSNFFCYICGAACLDSGTGYYTGCKHYLPDREPTEAEQAEIDNAVFGVKKMNLAERIDDFLEDRANAEADWDEKVSAFRDFVEMELQEQRQRCANAIAEDGNLLDVFDSDIEMMKESCLNAVEKEDE